MANPAISDVSGELSAYTVTWTLTTADPTGVAILFPQYIDRSIQIESVAFGASTCILEGSNDGTNFEPLRSPDSVALSFAAAGLKQVLESTAQMRPRLSVVGVAATVVVTMLMRRNNPMRT